MPGTSGNTASAAQAAPDVHPQTGEELVETSISGYKISGTAARQVQNDKLPKRHKVAPTFDGNKPSTLTKYLSELEDIFKYFDVTEGGAKITLALQYMDWNTRKIHK